MSLGDKSADTTTRLLKQREIVDSNTKIYINFIQNSEESYNSKTAKTLESLQGKIKIAREKTDQKESK